MRNGATLSGAFWARIDAVQALLSAAEERAANSGRLRDLASALDELATRCADARIALAYSAFAELIRAVAMLVDWRAAVRGAAIDADRFLRSARELHRAWLKEYGQREEAAQLANAGAPISNLANIEEVGSLCKAVGSVPLPVGVYAAESRPPTRSPGEESGRDRASPSVDLTVAFVQFNVDGQPAAETHFLTPQEAHDLEIEVRISRWPDRAEALSLAPVTIEARQTYDFPTFRFLRPSGDPPYCLKDRGRAALLVSQGLRAQPFEFRYAADFEPAGVEQPVAVVGHRNLRMDGIDSPITGYHGVDRRILEIRDALRMRPLVTPADVTSTLTLLKVLGNLAGRAVQENLFPEPMNEPDFQVWLRDLLRQQPEIGSKLEEHPKAAGGTTDLSFERIRLELKVSDDRPLRLPHCRRFVGQASTYAAGSDKRIGMLCVLDGSCKNEQPFPAEEGIGILRTGDDAIAVVTVLLQGNLTRPSDLSRRGRDRAGKNARPGGHGGDGARLASRPRSQSASAHRRRGSRSTRPARSSAPLG